MEKRWSERKRLCVGVDVYLRGDLLNQARSADIGLGGTFLSVEPQPALYKDIDVELVFRLAADESGEETIRHKINARVVRSNEQGVGFKFCNFDTTVFRSLQEIMAYQSEKGESSCDVVGAAQGSHRL